MGKVAFRDSDRRSRKHIQDPDGTPNARRRARLDAVAQRAIEAFRTGLQREPSAVLGASGGCWSEGELPTEVERQSTSTCQAQEIGRLRAELQRVKAENEQLHGKLRDSNSTNEALQSEVHRLRLHYGEIGPHDVGP